MGVFDAVFASSVRQTVLLELQASPRQRRDLLDDVDASKSAVYNALNELRDRDLVREGRSRRWETTGLGDIVADYVTEREHANDVLSTHADFWTGHDPTVIPSGFRESLGVLKGCSHLTAPDTEPFRIIGEVVDVLERAAYVDLVTPIYHDRYAKALERAATASSPPNRGDAADVRLVLATDVLTEVEERDDADWDDDNPAVRIADPGFSLLVTDETTMLALPDDDGEYDPGEKLRADTDDAREWGRRLFEHFWRSATPIEAINAMDATEPPSSNVHQ